MQEVHLEAIWRTPGGDSSVDPALVIKKFPWVIGRSSACDFQVENPLVSRRHCAFYERGGQLWVQDLGSQNGTRLNGERLTHARPVRDGDQLDLACLPFRIHVSAAELGAASHRAMGRH